MTLKKMLRKIDDKIKNLSKEKVECLNEAIDQDIENFFSTEPRKESLEIPDIVKEEFPFLFGR